MIFSKKNEFIWILIEESKKYKILQKVLSSICELPKITTNLDKINTIFEVDDGKIGVFIDSTRFKIFKNVMEILEKN